MNTFMHLLTQDDQLRALRHWREHMAPGALLLIDVFHPDVNALANTDGRLIHDRTWTDPQTGETVMKSVTTTVDLADQIMHVTLIYELLGADGLGAAYDRPLRHSVSVALRSGTPPG